MGHKPKLRPNRRLHKSRLARGAYAAAALGTVAGGLLLTAPGSQALSGVSAHPDQSASVAAPPGYRRRVASWYRDDGLRTACGFTANYGVANKKLPCGTHVKFWRAGHTVTAVVDDRGPYVAGRTWDLDEHTARRLHFKGIGVGYVWAKW
jgi:rare lipoprotein A (peptidoglycan hydrolase)